MIFPCMSDSMAAPGASSISMFGWTMACSGILFNSLQESLEHSRDQGMGVADRVDDFAAVR